MSDGGHEIRVSALTKRTIGLIADHPVLALLLGLGLAAAAGAGLARVRADFTHRGFFWDHDPYLRQFEAFERRFGNDDAVVIAVHSPSGVFDMETAGLLRRMTDRMWHVPEIIRVDSLANYNWVHAEGDEIKVAPLFPDALTPEILGHRKGVALAHEVLPDYLVSRDATTALVVARVKPGLESAPNAGQIIGGTRKLLDELRAGDHTFHVGGGPAVTFAFEEIAQKDLGRLLPMALASTAVFLVFTLRSLAGLLLPFVVLLLTVAATFGFAGWAGLTLTTMSTALPSILIATCVADTVHILVTFFEQGKRGHDRKTAARGALELNFLATFLTAFTTALGFASFAQADLKPVAGLGYMAAFGAMLAWALTYLVLGALLFILPVKMGRIRPESAALDQRLATRYTAFLGRHRRKAMAIAAVVTVGSFALAVRNEVNADPFKYFDKDVPVRIANEFVEKAVGGSRGFELVVSAGAEDGVKDPAFLRKVDALQTWIAAQPGITRTISLVDVLKQMNRSLHRDDQTHYRLPDDREAIAQELLLYTMSLPQGMDINDRITIKNDALRMTVLNTIATSREAVQMVEAIEAKAQDLGLDAHGTGKYTLYQRTNGYVVKAFLTSTFTAIFSITLVMVIFLRSIKLGLVAMIPNLVPIVVGGAFLKLIGQPLDMGTVIVASVCLGIAVDDTIHVLANYRRLRSQGLPPDEAVASVLAHVGRALVATTAILVISFGSFVFADFTPNLYFGMLTAVILGVALLTDLTVTCAILMQSRRTRA